MLTIDTHLLQLYICVVNSGRIRKLHGSLVLCQYVLAMTRQITVYLSFRSSNYHNLTSIYFGPRLEGPRTCSLPSKQSSVDEQFSLTLLLGLNITDSYPSSIQGFPTARYLYTTRYDVLVEKRHSSYHRYHLSKVSSTL